MPAVARRYISAATGDYEVSAGGLREDTGFTSEVALALRTKLGSMAMFPEFGSRLHEIRYADERGRKMAEKRAGEAITHLRERYEDIVVTASLPKAHPGRIDIVVSGKRGGTTFTANYSANVGTV